MPGDAAEEFVSEPLRPHRGTFSAGPMAQGLPGLPDGFDWRDAAYPIVEVLDFWKTSAAEGGRVDGERYLRRHYFRLRMGDGAVWTVYFTRQPLRGGAPRQRWFLYSISRLA